MGRTTTKLGWALVAVLGTMGVGREAGATVKVGSIGDSISRAFDANDGCSNLATCLPKVGDDLNSSWSTGDAGWSSMRDHLNNCNDGQGGCPGNITYVGAISGQRWRDAYNQATALVANGGGVNFVTIEMGGNDVCVDLGEALPSYSEIYGEVQQTYAYLASALPAGSTVLTAHVPDINYLYQTMQNQPNFLEGTCQNLWNIGYGSNDSLLSSIVSALGHHFPCGTVLSSSSNASNRAAADQLNQEINSIIDQLSAQYSGTGNGVKFVVSGDVYSFQFTTHDVSQIDCFHPSRQGQTDLANRIWQGIGGNEYGGTQAVTVFNQQTRLNPQLYDVKTWLSNPGYEVYWIQNCNDPSDACYNVANCYLWTTSWTSSYFDTQVGGSWINPNDQYRIWSMPENPNGSYSWANQYVPASCN